MAEEVVPVLRVADAARAVAWYERLGFREEWRHQFEPGFPWFVSVARGDARIYLSEHTGDAPPGSLVHLYVDDVDAVAAELGIPVDEEGLAGREVDAEDPDGNRLRIATRRQRVDLEFGRRCGRGQKRTLTGDASGTDAARPNFTSSL